MNKPQKICVRSDLVERGPAIRFELESGAGKTPAFVVAFGNAVHAYENRCPHRGTELDWQPGQVFDESGLYLVCATHGALFEAASGLCIDGPCHGTSLTKVPIIEADGAVWCVAAQQRSA
jgi:nitrite reductase/ring-hydroxylating ferredoxin subunit